MQYHVGSGWLELMRINWGHDKKTVELPSWINSKLHDVDISKYFTTAVSNQSIFKYKQIFGRVLINQGLLRCTSKHSLFKLIFHFTRFKVTHSFMLSISLLSLSHSSIFMCICVYLFFLCLLNWLFSLDWLILRPLLHYRAEPIGYPSPNFTPYILCLSISV